MNQEIKKETEIRIDVGLDHNNVPLQLRWEASDGAGKGECKAMLLAMWDKKDEQAIRIDLWEKEMSVFDMQRFFHQTLLTMGDTYERATGQKDHAADIRSFARQFAKKAGIVS